MQLRAHTEAVVVQSIEDELVLVNLESGVYYALSGSAAVIFSLLDGGCHLDKLVEAVSECYQEDLKGSATEINEFVEQLKGESLLVPGNGTCGLSASGFVIAGFSLPVLNKYEDLQELLLLDPVRGVPSLDDVG